MDFLNFSLFLFWLFTTPICGGYYENSVKKYDVYFWSVAKFVISWKVVPKIQILNEF